MKMWRMGQDQKHAEGVVARRDEKIRVKIIKDMAKQGSLIFSHMLAPIQDPEILWKATDLTWIGKETKKDAAKKKVSGQQEDGGNKKDEDERDEEDEYVMIITNVSDHNRRFRTGPEAGDAKNAENEDDAICNQDDFIAFEEDGDNIQDLLDW